MKKQHPFRRIWVDILKSCALTAIVMLVNLAFEHTWWIERFRYTAYQSLQLALSPPNAGSVVVFDISPAADLERTEKPVSGDPRHLTPRESLKTLISKLAARNPQAIGVDIDFSLEKGLPRSRYDFGFFSFCKELTTNKVRPV